MLTLLKMRRHVASAQDSVWQGLLRATLSRCKPLSIPSPLWAAQSTAEDDFNRTCNLQREISRLHNFSHARCLLKSSRTMEKDCLRNQTNYPGINH